MITRRDFISFSAGTLATIGGLGALSFLGNRDQPVTRDQTKRAVVFLHIPKTGGTSLRDHIMQNIIASKVVMPEWPENIQALKRRYGFYLNQHDLIYVRGHFTRDWQKFLYSYSEHTTCMTMLRNPISRFRSAYDYQSNHWATPGSYMESVLERKPASLSDFIEIMDEDAFTRDMAGNHFMGEFNDGMTRRLAGEGWDVPFRATTQDMLDRAKENLKNRFSVIGITESYNQFLEMFGAHWGWDLQPQPRKNVSKKKSIITDQDREKILELNKLDQELYVYAKSLSEAMYKKFKEG